MPSQLPLKHSPPVVQGSSMRRKQSPTMLQEHALPPQAPSVQLVPAVVHSMALPPTHCQAPWQLPLPQTPLGVAPLCVTQLPLQQKPLVSQPVSVTSVTATHVPTLPATLHAWQTPHAPAQQTPSSQTPLAQRALFVPQGSPSRSLHAPLPSQVSLAAHVLGALASVVYCG